MCRNGNIFTKLDKYARLELTIYCVGWMMVMCLPIVSQIADVHFGKRCSVRWEQAVQGYHILIPIFLLFVINNFVLLPRLFWKGRKMWYCVVVAAMLVLLWFTLVPPHPRDIEFEMLRQAPMPDMFAPDMPPLPDMPPRPEGLMPRHHGLFDMFHLTNLVIGLCVIFANFGIKMYIQSMRQEVLVLNIQNEKVNQELQSLKYQVSPHFLMNTLNNIQSLIETDTTAAYKTIQQLSKMMRYLLYDNNTQRVELKKEVEFMRSFIELMRIRYPESVKVSADFPTDDKGLTIPPLLFISLIENAFKYGISYSEESLIAVKMDIGDGVLHFSCLNNIPQDGATRKKGSGIGIKNVQRRLDLIYGDSYDMRIETTEKTFMVELSLPLQTETT